MAVAYCQGTPFEYKHVLLYDGKKAKLVGIAC
jgi:hypothetical protein